jgi:hypothetical protein
MPPRTPLPDVLGFDDERIAQLEQERYVLIRRADVSVDSRDYAAYVFAPVGPGQGHERRLLLIYHMREHQPELLFESNPREYPIPVSTEDWGDLNQDGRPDLIINYSCLCNGWCGHWHDALQIESDGTLVDILPIQVHEFKDLDQDGAMELILKDCRGEMSGSAHVWGVSSFRVFSWHDLSGVQDVSAQYQHLYTESIERRLGEVQESYGKSMDTWAAVDVMAQAYGVLLDYENSGRRDEGWSIYWELTDPQHWPDLNQETAQVIIGRRERLRSRYETGREF